MTRTFSFTPRVGSDKMTSVKALTIRQPWASLIIDGSKDVENRSWPTNYRGILVVHAGAKDDPSEPAETDLPRGAIIGTVRVIDCVRDSESPWAVPGQYHWILSDPRPCRPRAARGQQGLWDLSPRDWAWVRRTRGVVPF
jgi:hypothetical protein